MGTGAEFGTFDVSILELGDGVPWSGDTETKTQGEHVALPVPVWVSCLAEKPSPPHVLPADGGQASGVDLVHERRLVVRVQGAIKGVHGDHRVVRHYSASGKSFGGGF